MKGNQYGRQEEYDTCEDCSGCPYAEKCKKAEKNRTVRINAELSAMYQEVLDHLQSIYGALLRMNRSIPLLLFSYRFRKIKRGIRFGKAYEVAEQAARQVIYADRFELEQEILRRRDDCDEDEELGETLLPAAGTSKSSGQLHASIQERREHRGASRKLPLRTD